MSFLLEQRAMGRSLLEAPIILARVDRSVGLPLTSSNGADPNFDRMSREYLCLGSCN